MIKLSNFSNNKYNKIKYNNPNHMKTINENKNYNPISKHNQKNHHKNPLNYKTNTPL